MEKVFDIKGLEKFAKKELKTLKWKCFNLNLYRAGKNKDEKRGFNFYARDLILSAILLNDLELLKNSLELCLILQGKKNNPYNERHKNNETHQNIQ